MIHRLVTPAAALALVLVFGPSIVEHVGHGFVRGTFNDDVRQQIFPFFKYVEGGPTGPDLPGTYQLDLMPIGYTALYRGLMPVVDPEPLSKLLPYVQWIVMLVALAAVSWRLGGRVAAVATIALTLQTPIFFERLGGGMPRGFAFPAIAVGLWALVTGRVRLLAALVVAAQAFYFVAATVLGLMLAALLFVVPRKDRGEASGWSRWQRVRLLALVGVLAAALTVPVWLASRPYGRLLGPGDAEVYPEVGPSGRFGPGDMLPPDRDFTSRIWPEVEQQTGRALRGAGPPIVPALSLRGAQAERAVTLAILIASGVGVLLLANRDPAARRALALVGAGLCGYALASVAAPYFYVPQRFTIYTLPLCVVVLVPVGGAMLAAALAPPALARVSRAAGVALTAGLALLCLGGRGDARAGYPITLDPGAPLYRFVRALPPDALLAGWPNGVIDNVPYVCRRRALLTRENHLVFHEGYVLEMREHMQRLMAAFYGTDRQAVIDLRDAYGVTHVIVARDYSSAPAPYFAPFEVEVLRLRERAGSRPLAFDQAAPGAEVYQDEVFRVIDLSRY